MSEITIYDPDQAAGRSLTLPEKLQYANALANSEMIPKAYRGKPANLLVAIEYGTMLDIHPLSAVNLIHVIDGKPTQAAELMRSQVIRAGHKCRITKHSPTEGAVMIVRHDDPEFPLEVTWTMEDAERAGLRDLWWEDWRSTNNGKNFKETWIAPGGFPVKPTVDDMKRAGAPEWACKQGPGRMKKQDSWWNYPQSMLLARATSDCVRAICPEVLMGVSYTAEELGAAVDADGHVLDVAEAPRLLGPEMRGFVERYDVLPAELQSKLIGKLRQDAHAPDAVLPDFGEAWWPAIGRFLDFAESKAAEVSAPEPGVSDGLVGDPVHATGGGDGGERLERDDPPAPPTGQGRVVGDAPTREEGRDGNRNEAAASPAAEVGQGEHSNLPAEGGAAPVRDVAPPPTDVIEVAEVTNVVELNPADRPAVMGQLHKVFPYPEGMKQESDRKEYSREILLNLVAALGYPGLTSRTEITPTAWGLARGALGQLERGEVELQLDEDGVPHLYATERA